MTEVILGAIWAQAANGVIGRDGDMPWYAPEDLAHFKEVTGKSPVIMGRMTWESIPERFRPLPGRTNLVVSSSTSSDGEEKNGALWFASLEAAISAGVSQAVSAGESQMWIMGGASVYAQALEFSGLAGVTDGGVSVIERTVFGQDVEGDAHAPSFDEKTWQLASATQPETSGKGYVLDQDGGKQPLTYTFETWEKP